MAKKEDFFMHSKCCGKHFEGRIRKDRTCYIECEKCGKFVANLKEVFW